MYKPPSKQQKASPTPKTYLKTSTLTRKVSSNTPETSFPFPLPLSTPITKIPSSYRIRHWTWNSKIEMMCRRYLFLKQKITRILGPSGLNGDVEVEDLVNVYVNEWNFRKERKGKERESDDKKEMCFGTISVSITRKIIHIPHPHPLSTLQNPKNQTKLKIHPSSHPPN